MKPEDVLEFHGPDEIMVRGHRIGLEHVVDLYRDGYSTEQIAQELPGLALAKIEAVIDYYLAHKRDVDAYLRRLDAREQSRIRQESLDEPDVVRRLRTLRDQRQRALR